jgi:hypothetical protein
MNLFLAGFAFGIATLWAFLELIALVARRRDRPIPYISPAWEREEGVRYEFLGQTGMEE